MVRRWSRLRAITCRWYMGMSAKARIPLLGSSNEGSDAFTVASHQHVRQSAGLFDVGHMVQSQYVNAIQSVCTSLTNKKKNPISFRGATATDFLEWLTPSSLSTLEPYTSTLSVLLNEQGGIIDDLMITKHASDAFYVVTNAGRRTEDLAWFAARLAEWNASERSNDGPVEHEVLEGWGLLALQGSAVQFRVGNQPC